jgi:hypothetical protein
MLTRTLLILCLCGVAICDASDDESVYGISVPVTISGGVLHTSGNRTEDGLEPATAAAFRGVISPTVRLGSHWFFYSSVAIQSASYFDGTYYNYNESPVSAELMHAFLGYSRKLGNISWLFKAGRLSSAFGLAPLEYDDAKMPLLMPPPAYTSAVPLRPDQLPCGTADFWSEQYGEGIEFRCGGSESESYGLTPVTLYGLPGVEAEISAGRIDGRLQITNSSPANPQGLLSENQALQWTVGGGYSFLGGLHVGVSGFRGPYLNKVVEPLLPAGEDIHRFHASGFGVDAQWSRGPWSLEGEWQKFWFDMPGFFVAPTVQTAYGQAKRILSPRVFAATRLSFERFGPIKDTWGSTMGHFQVPRKAIELAMGYRLNRLQLIKAGFALSDFTAAAYSDGLQNTVQLQLVTDVTAISKAFH